MHKCLQMGCLSSRSTSVRPIDFSEPKTTTTTTKTRNADRDLRQTNNKKPINNVNSFKHQKVTNGHMLTSTGEIKGKTRTELESLGQQMQDQVASGLLANNNNNNNNNGGDMNNNYPNTMNKNIDEPSQTSETGADDDIMSILMIDQERSHPDNNNRETEIDSNLNGGDAGGGGGGGSNKVNEIDPHEATNGPKNEKDKRASKRRQNRRGDDEGGGKEEGEDEEEDVEDEEGEEEEEEEDEDEDDPGLDNDRALVSNEQQKQTSNTENSSFDEDLNVDLLRQYIMVDYEITQLEDRDALRVYHEKIEQLEQLERELDMISLEAEEIAARDDGDPKSQLLDRFQMLPTMNDFNGSKQLIGGQGGDGESNSMLSGATESIASRKSSMRRQQKHQQQQLSGSINTSITMRNSSTNNNNNNNNHNNNNNGSGNGNNQLISSNSNSNSQAQGNELVVRMDTTGAYSTIEEVFNRKIILEKERDRLKKEVEFVIVECDKLQNRYKRRDEILDKLFDGRTGNGLENHLEQQLQWLMEQKHYVDQVFYAWKRAETLTSQTCEQIASALEILKRMSKVQDEQQKVEMARSIGQLLLKSRQDMEQAQRYNPNVDAPFFTDTETERFDKTIEKISRSKSINQNDYNQIATVLQFAYKRAVSIRVWLEQILQITIARDSFELAEEYKWIAIQLRKERITLIKSKLREQPYRSMFQSTYEQMSRQQQQQPQLNNRQQPLAITDITSVSALSKPTSLAANGSQQQQQQQQQPNGGGSTNEINRDSGIESDDIDIEEEIYRLLEMNKSRLEAAIVASGSTMNQDQNLAKFKNDRQIPFMNNNNQQQQHQQIDDRMMRDRIERRLRGELALGVAGRMPPNSNAIMDQVKYNQINSNIGSPGGDMQIGSAGTTTSTNMTNNSQIASATSSTMTPSKLRVELDETSRQNLIKQVDQAHEKHRSKMERLRGSNRAKASNSIMNRVKQARQQYETG